MTQQLDPPEAGSPVLATARIDVGPMCQERDGTRWLIRCRDCGTDLFAGVPDDLLVERIRDALGHDCREAEVRVPDRPGD
jgi:hypothetical protein